MGKTTAYGIIELSFWRDPEIKRLSRDAREMLVYLFSAPDSVMLGIFYCPAVTIAYETQIPLAVVERLLRGAAVEGASEGASDAPSTGCREVLGADEDLARWITFDLDTDEVFIHNMARKRVGDHLAPRDNRRSPLARQLAQVRSPRLAAAFLQRYASWGLDPASSDTDDAADAEAHEGASEGASGGTSTGGPGAREQRTGNRDSSSSSAPAADEGDRPGDADQRDAEAPSAIAYAQGCVIACNQGLTANPKLDGHNELVTSNELAVAEEWRAAGVPLALATAVVFARAKAYKPKSRHRQPTSLRYFQNAVLEAHERAQERAAGRRTPAPDGAAAHPGRAPHAAAGLSARNTRVLEAAERFANAGAAASSAASAAAAGGA